MNGLAAGAWVWPVVPALCFMNAFFPPFPSDETIMATSAVWHDQLGRLVIIWILGSIGAWSGDQCMYQLGRMGWRRGGDGPPGSRREKAYALARRTLERGGTAGFVMARFVPGGRVSVSILAGRTGFPPQQFRFATAVGVPVVIAYDIAVGGLLGSYLIGNPLIVASGGLVFGAAVPTVVTLVRRIYRGIRRRLRGTPGPTAFVVPPRPTHAPPRPAPEPLELSDEVA